MNSSPTADPIFHFADLESWSRPEISLAVLGHPIGHSLSPPMHNAALAAVAPAEARFAEWRYFRFDIRPADLAPALALMHARGFRGVNLTVPHKVIAFELVSHVDESARPIGAVNTLLRNADGWRGFNTDGYGLAAAVREGLGRKLAGIPIILLGAGGAARGAAVECLQRRCASLTLLNRTRKNLDRLLTALTPVRPDFLVSGLTLDCLDPGRLPADALVINATSAGLSETDAAPLDLTAMPRPAAVLDMIYNPALTPLLRSAIDLGIPRANGLGMLVHQGARALEIWSGIPAIKLAPTMAAAARTALAQS